MLLSHAFGSRTVPILKMDWLNGLFAQPTNTRTYPHGSIYSLRLSKIKQSSGSSTSPCRSPSNQYMSCFRANPRSTSLPASYGLGLHTPSVHVLAETVVLQHTDPQEARHQSANAHNEHDLLRIPICPNDCFTLRATPW